MTTKQTQLLLHYLAEETGDSRFSPGEIDGIPGKNTNAALAHLKSIYGVGAEGLVGVIAGTVAKLPAAAPVKTWVGTFWDSIKYFTREEFACHGHDCSGFPVEPKEKLVRLLDAAREHFGVAGIISSGVRCGQHNAEVGGVYNSRHLQGLAADIRFVGIAPGTVVAWAMSHGANYAYSIQSGGKDTGYVHIDVTE